MQAYTEAEGGHIQSLYSGPTKQEVTECLWQVSLD